jgi:hypothetical protein
MLWQLEFEAIDHDESRKSKNFFLSYRQILQKFKPYLIFSFFLYYAATNSKLVNPKAISPCSNLSAITLKARA